MIHFLHPNAAWLFLFLVPILLFYLRNPQIGSIQVPSLLLWNENTEKSGLIHRHRFHLCYFPFSFWMISSAIILLVSAAMTPFHYPQTEMDKKEFTILRFGPESEPLERGLAAFTEIPIKRITDISYPLSENEILVITGEFPSPLPEGNLLAVEQIDSANDEEEADFQSISEVNREILKIRYSYSFTKTVQFPIFLGKSIEHFRNAGVVSLPEKQKEPHRYSFLLSLGAAAVLLVYCFYSGFRNWKE